MQIKILVLFLILLLIFLPFVQSQQIYYVKGAYFNNNVRNSNVQNSLVSYGSIYQNFFLKTNQWAFELFFIPKDCANTNAHIYVRSYNATRADGVKTYSQDGIVIYLCRIQYIWYQPISGAGIPYTNLTTGIELGAKYHVVIAFDNPTLYFYVNGTFVLQRNVGANTLFNSSVYLNVGGWKTFLTGRGHESRYGSNATLYLLRVYNTTLTSSQVAYNFNAIKNFDFENYYSNYLVLYYAPFSVYENRWVNIAQNNFRTDIILVNTQLEDLQFYYAITTTTTTIHNQLSFNFGAINYILAIMFIGFGTLILIYMARRM